MRVPCAQFSSTSTPCGWCAATLLKDDGRVANQPYLWNTASLPLSSYSSPLLPGSQPPLPAVSSGLSQLAGIGKKGDDSRSAIHTNYSYGYEVWRAGAPYKLVSVRESCRLSEEWRPVDDGGRSCRNEATQAVRESGGVHKLCFRMRTGRKHTEPHRRTREAGGSGLVRSWALSLCFLASSSSAQARRAALVPAHRTVDSDDATAQPI